MNVHHTSLVSTRNLLFLLGFAAFIYSLTVVISSSSVWHSSESDSVLHFQNVVVPTRHQQQKHNFPASSPSSSSFLKFNPKLKNHFKSDTRTGEMFMGTAVSSSDLIFNDFSTLCSSGVGTVRCSLSRPNRSAARASSLFLPSSSSSFGSCCCSWTPLARSCTGPFNQSNLPLMRRVLSSHFVHSPTSQYQKIPPISTLSQISCPWFDQGQWSLPDNFLDLSFDDAARASVRASRGGGGSFQRQQEEEVDDEEYRLVDHEKKFRKNIGPLLVWKLGREMRRLKGHRGTFTSKTTTTTTTTMNFSSPGMLIISGDSIVRQVFTRLIHAIRSRECRDENEMFRGGVFERYYHLSAGYVVTTRGDALELEFEKGCERVAKEPRESTLVAGGGTVLLRICYVWDNRKDPSMAGLPPVAPGERGEQAERGTEYAIARISRHTPIAAVVYWPTIHNCTFAGGDCSNASVSNGAVLSVFAAAGRHAQVPRVVVANSMQRNWYPGFFHDSIRKRNDDLKSYFTVNFWHSVSKHLDHDRILRYWRASKTRRETWRKVYDDIMMIGQRETSLTTTSSAGNSSKHGNKSPETKKNVSRASARNNVQEFYFVPDDDDDDEDFSDHRHNKADLADSASLFRTTENSKFRFYDFGSRHRQVTPRQCDHGHSMCMFWPLRVRAGKSVLGPVNGMTGICPNGSRCEDPWNFLFMHDLVALLLA